MKTYNNRAALVLAAVLSGVVLGSAGCQSNSKSPALNQGASTSESIQSAADAIVATRTQVNVTTAALRNLVERPQDIPAQYKIVAEQVAKLKANADKIAASANNIRTKGDQYLADWSKQVAAIQDPELRSAAFDRRADVSVRLQEIFRSYQGVKAAFEPYQANIKDIQSVLGADLSAKGLEAVKPFVAKATANAAPLKAELDKLAAEFRAVGVSLKP